MPADDALRGSIDDALDRADAVLVEGRARVRDLRTETANGDLARALVDAASGIVDGGTLPFQLTVEGRRRPVHALVGQEIVRVAEEAIRNAAMHARATRLDALLVYGRRELQLAVSDDGTGIPGSVLQAGSPEGHYGLVGMRERAERIGGRLTVSSREGAGTEVTLTVPARAAYSARRSSFLDRRRGQNQRT
jgi:signal transduction histidine kinase